MNGCRWQVVMIALLLGLPGSAVQAQAGGADLSADAVAGAQDAESGAKPDSKSVCVDAEVDGARALSYNCLSRQLAPKAIAGSANPASTAANALATGPSNRVGTFNESAESIRFGTNWGKSVLPQRPSQPQAVPLGH